MMKRKSFTLIELLISLLMLILIIMGIWQVINSALISKRYVRENFEATKAGKAILNLILTDLKYSYKHYYIDENIDSKSTSTKAVSKAAKLSGPVEQNTEGWDSNFMGESVDVGDLTLAKLSFDCKSPMWDPRIGRVPEVTTVTYYAEEYTMDDDTAVGRVALIRASNAKYFKKSNLGKEEAVLETGELDGFVMYKGIRLFHVEYYNGLEWVEVWTASGDQDIPLAVRVDMVINSTEFNKDFETLSWEGYEEDLDLQEGDERFRGMVKIQGSFHSIDDVEDEN